MILSYAQLLLVCFSFWSAWEAVARALRRQWAMALSFGGIVLFCLLIPKSEWLLLALVDGALLIVARRTERPIHAHAAPPPKPIPWDESIWQVSVVGLLPVTLLETLIWLAGHGSVAAWLMDWLLLIVLAGGVAGFLTRDDSVATEPDPTLRLRQKECRWIGLYEAGPESLPYDQRRCAERFPQQSTRFIHLAGWLLVTKASDFGDVTCPCVYRYTKPDGKLLAEKREDVLITRGFQEFAFDWGWGWPEPGHWESGTYRVEVLIAGQRVKTGSFTIDPPPPPPTLTEILSQSTVRFYALRTGYDTRQDSVHFSQQTTREIICALTVRNLFYRQCDRTYQVTAQCYTPEGSLLWEDRRDWLIKAIEQQPSITWEWQESGPWKAGAYRVDISIDGEDFAWGAFAIE